MSAIDKMEAELMRLGVEYDFTDQLREVPSYQSVTWWFNTADKATFREYHDGSTQLIVRSVKSGVTPEQAIAATLGRGECHVVPIGEFDGESTEYYAICSNCGYEFEGDPLKFCPECGAKVIDE